MWLGSPSYRRVDYRPGVQVLMITELLLMILLMTYHERKQSSKNCELFIFSLKLPMKTDIPLLGLEDDCSSEYEIGIYGNVSHTKILKMFEWQKSLP